MANMPLKWSGEIAIAVAVTTINILMSNHLVDHAQYGLYIAQAWSGLAVTLGLSYAAGIRWHKSDTTAVSPSSGFFRPSWLLVALWAAICCTLPWITLPASGAFGLSAALLFIGLACQQRHFDVPTSTLRVGMLSGLLCFTVFLALIGLSPFHLSRLMADFAGPLDLQGRHYFHAIALQVLSGVQAFGPSPIPLPMHFDRAKTFDLLRLAHSTGAIPAALLALSIVIFWLRIFTWLRSRPPGNLLSGELQRLGQALIALHGIATILNVLWNFGITRQPFSSGLPPLTQHAGWWMLSGTLVWILVRAYRQQAQIAVVPSSSPPPNWKMAGILTCITVVLTLGLLVAVDSAKDAYAAIHPEQSPHRERRDITDQYGRIIATSVPAADLWIVPNEFWSTSIANPGSGTPPSTDQMSDQRRRDQLFSALNEWPQLRTIVASRLDSYGKSDGRKKILAWGIKPEIADKIAATKLDGLILSPRPVRLYPQGSLFAHALGFASLSDLTRGQEGLELAENNALLHDLRGRDGNALPPLRTTLDPEIQRTATLALNESISQYGATGGAVVVIEAQSEKIRAMVSAPGFDANDDTSFRNPYQPERILNRARGVNFPMGHLLTPLLAAHLIETGRMQATTQVAIGKKLTIGKRTIEEISPTDTLSLTEIVAKSSNVGAAKLALGLPLTELRDITRNLGIGVPLRLAGTTGNIDFEAVDWAKWTPAMQAEPGRYISSNLLQATRAYLPLVNGGRLARLSLIDGAPSQSDTPRMLSSETVKTVREMLTNAASIYGTAPKAQSSGTIAAGKTDTNVASNGHPVVTFIGMAPAEPPRWLIGVLLEFPKHRIRLAGDTAAPLFATIYGRIMTPKESNQ